MLRSWSGEGIPNRFFKERADGFAAGIAQVIVIGIKEGPPGGVSDGTVFEIEGKIRPQDAEIFAIRRNGFRPCGDLPPKIVLRIRLQPGQTFACFHAQGHDFAQINFFADGMDWNLGNQNDLPAKGTNLPEKRSQLGFKILRGTVP